MTTESRTVIVPVVREDVTASFAKTADATKEYTAGIGCIVIIDNTYNQGDLTVTLDTRADPWGRTDDPSGGAYSPFTVSGGTIVTLGPFSSALYGQGTNYQDLHFDLAVGATKVATPTTPAGVGSDTGGSLTGAPTTYYYVCTACDLSDGESAKSAEMSGTVTTGSSGSVALSCDAMTGAAYYKWYRGATGGPYYLVGASISPAFTDTDLGLGTSYVAPAAATTADAVAHVRTECIKPTQAQTTR